MTQAVEEEEEGTEVFTFKVSAEPLSAAFANAFRHAKAPGTIAPLFFQIDDTELVTMVEVTENLEGTLEQYKYNICFPVVVEDSDLDPDTFVCVRIEDASGANGACAPLKALKNKPVEVMIETTHDDAKITIGGGVLDIMLDGTNRVVPPPSPDDYSGSNEDLGIRWDPEETEHSEVLFKSEKHPGYYITTTLNNHDDPDELFKVRQVIDKNTTPEIEGNSFMAESARRKLKKGAKEIAVPAVEDVQPKTPRPTPATKKKLVTEEQVREAMMVMDAEEAPTSFRSVTAGTESPGTKDKGSKRRSKNEMRLDKIAEAGALLLTEQHAEDVREEIMRNAVAIVENNGREVVITNDEAEQSLKGTLEAALLTNDRLRQYIQHAPASADTPEAPVETPEDFRKRALALLVSELV